MNKEILLIVESLSNEKGVDKETVFEAVEAAPLLHPHLNLV